MANTEIGIHGLMKELSETIAKAEKASDSVAERLPALLSISELLESSRRIASGSNRLRTHFWQLNGHTLLFETLIDASTISASSCDALLKVLVSMCRTCVEAPFGLKELAASGGAELLSVASLAAATGDPDTQASVLLSLSELAGCSAELSESLLTHPYLPRSLQETTSPKPFIALLTLIQSLLSHTSVSSLLSTSSHQSLAKTMVSSLLSIMMSASTKGSLGSKAPVLATILNCLLVFSSFAYMKSLLISQMLTTLPTFSNLLTTYKKKSKTNTKKAKLFSSITTSLATLISLAEQRGEGKSVKLTRIRQDPAYAATLIQACWRSYAGRRRWRATVKAVTRLQARARGKRERSKFAEEQSSRTAIRKEIRAQRKLQSRLSESEAMLETLKSMDPKSAAEYLSAQKTRAAIIIQCSWRRYRALTKFKDLVSDARKQEAARVIQRFMVQSTVSNSYQRQKARQARARTEREQQSPWFQGAVDVAKIPLWRVQSLQSNIQIHKGLQEDQSKMKDVARRAEKSLKDYDKSKNQRQASYRSRVRLVSIIDELFESFDEMSQLSPRNANHARLNPSNKSNYESMLKNANKPWFAQKSAIELE